jgi:hypothetical protein
LRQFQRDAGLHRQRAVDRIEPEHLVHALQADHQFAVRRHSATGQSGAAARRHDGDRIRLRPAHDRLHLLDMLPGKAIASGAGVQRRVQSRP